MIFSLLNVVTASLGSTGTMFLSVNDDCNNEARNRVQVLLSSTIQLTLEQIHVTLEGKAK